MPANFPPVPPSPSPAPMLDDSAVLALTSDGERELREPGTTLPSAHLEALVRIDGLATVAQLLAQARGVDPDGLRATLTELIDKNFVCVVGDSADKAVDAGDFFTLEIEHTDVSDPGEQAHAEAESNTDFLRRNGYYVNMARRSAVRQELPAGRKLTILVIDDDPDICKLLQIYLKLEGLDSRTAANRAEILAEFRRPTLPDLVLLDVHLTDANGFDILAKMRQHPVLKTLPVIMLTAEATREAVLRGILGGADGYITKPFQIHPLVKAVKAVLGLKYDATDQDWDFSL